MGARKKRAPRRGSLGFSPRKRASRLVPRVKRWPEVDIGKPVPLAFLGYRAGMTHVFMVDDRPGRPTSGKEIFVPVTIVETPPMFVAAVRLYGYDPNRGRYSLGEAWAQPPPELELQRRISTLGSFDTDKMLKSLEERLDKAEDVRLIAASQPKLAGGLSKKKPDLLEIKVGGVSDVTKLFDYAKDVLGNLIAVNDVFEEGQLVDVIAVTKGKGFQGVIKRWGVKELPRWHKHRKGSRRIGARSHGRSTFWETPQAGQTGFHRRTEYNKRILMIDDDGYKVTPAGGFLRYGVVRSTFVMLSGSIPGTPKRPIVMRWAIRPPEWYLKLGVRKPEITYISLASKQGV
ncbi:50S ribosomal protein L3P [Aeropyrum pernix K1]|uniref:Large ribosomal subunit protein uL3 n=1 Tax=Aeropyrum pernix (strain ATCC 700893 / DSM 11879 / JCM 9820 / NBRC 100138 / K1) TaxID=272557 RepID=RL3_AERPE|nr:50S ribosomal protein L3 [Aeropyrum pernix]Q9YFM2.1 RecName: Full=Large ribosomal subunit protein uL3; AltName: Full=50S ribosomal protein L3 [Aeropyrum pernix K1]BAA79139.1 50S ribosomal protein L3P [Aeropyrum pernix K1]